MRKALHVFESTGAHAPCAEVPLEDLWDLVEFLSWHRVLATYDFAATHYLVMFPHLDLEAAKNLVAQWEVLDQPHEPAHA